MNKLSEHLLQASPEQIDRLLSALKNIDAM